MSKPIKSIWFWGLATLGLFASVAGCDQPESKQYALTKEQYQGKNIIKNGNFNNGLLYWKGLKDYIRMLDKESTHENSIAVIHSLDSSIIGPERFMIAGLSQSFTIQPGDFQLLMIRAKTKSTGGVTPSILVEFSDSSLINDENANYGILDSFREISKQSIGEWHNIEFSRNIPTKADTLAIWYTGVPTNEQSHSLWHATEAFEVYYDDVEAILDAPVK